MYRTAEHLAQSIGVAMPIIKSVTSQDIESLPHSNIGSNYVDIASKNLSSIRNLQQDIKNIQIEIEFSINKLELQKEKFIDDSNQKVRSLNYNLKGAPYPQHNEIISIEYKLKKYSKKSKNPDGLVITCQVLFILVCIVLLLSLYYGTNNLGSFIFVVITIIVCIAATMLGINSTIESYNLSKTNELKIELNKLICESENYSKNIEQLKQEILSTRNILRNKIENFNDEISSLSNSLYSQKFQKNEQIDNLKDELICQIKRISDCASTAKSIALELSPIEFEEDTQECKLILGLSLEYWEIGSSDLSASRMLARPWEDDAWRSSYQPHLGTQTPDCISIGNYFVNRINPETNQKVNPMEVPAMIPIRAFKPENNSRLPGHVVIFSNTQTRNIAIELLESIATRLISTFPVRSLKGSFIDPIALGNTFPFKGLPKSILSGQQIFTRNQDIREEFKTLVTHVEQVIQNYTLTGNRLNVFKRLKAQS
jgi:hypothetical protein